MLVGVGGFDVAVANDLLEETDGIDGIDGIELNFVDIGTKGDEDILTLLAFDADDFTFGVP